MDASIGSFHLMEVYFPPRKYTIGDKYFSTKIWMVRLGFPHPVLHWEMEMENKTLARELKTGLEKENEKESGDQKGNV